MRVFHWLLLLLTVFAFILIAILCSDVPSGASGILHPEYSTMLKGGSSIAESTTVKWLGLFFGIGIMLFFVMGIFIGMDSRPKSIRNEARVPFLIGTALYLLVFIALTLAYWSLYDSGSSVYLGGFPLPTAILLYGVTFVPILFTILYVRNFHSWVLSSDELESFHEIKRKRIARMGNAEKSPS